VFAPGQGGQEVLLRPFARPEDKDHESHSPISKLDRYTIDRIVGPVQKSLVASTRREIRTLEGHIDNLALYTLRLRQGKPTFSSVLQLRENMEKLKELKAKVAALKKLIQ
jgi:hypothetical protein